MSQQQSSRGNPAMGDIIRSMVVIALIVLAVWAVGRFFTSNPDDPSPTVDYKTVVAQARPAADFPLLAPSSLPQGWKATSARFNPTTWHLGVLTDDGDYIGLEQTSVSIDRAVDQYADGSKAAGTTQVAGEAWTVRKGPQNRLTLVRRDGGVTILVNGTAPRAQIDDYVSSLTSS